MTNYISNYLESIQFIQTLKDKVIACDIESTSFNFYDDNAKLISISFAESETDCTVIATRLWTDEQVVELINQYNNNVKVSIFHNYYFDNSYTLGRYGVGLRCDYDTYLMTHTLLIERKLEDKGLSLKDLARDFTEYGDYEAGLNQYKTDYCKQHNIKKSEFTYDLIPDDILLPYNALDCICTMIIYNKCIKYMELVKAKRNWKNPMEMIQLKHDITKEYIKSKVRGIHINRDMIYELDKEFKTKRAEYENMLKVSKEINDAIKILCRNELHKQKKIIVEKIKVLKSTMPINTNTMPDLSGVVPDDKFIKAHKRKIEYQFNKLKELSLEDMIAETEFNFNSSPQKRILFYKVLDIEKKYYTKSKALATGKIILERYGHKHDILKLFKAYSTYNKGITSFLGTENITDEDEEEDEEIPSSNNSLLACVTKDNKIYPSVNIAGTTTSRLSMTHLNLAQMPSRGELYVLRKCIVPSDENYTFISFDYQNLECKLVATLAQEDKLIKAFKEGLDLHAMTALGIFKDKMDIDYTKSLKEQCKEVKAKYGETYRYYSKSVNIADSKLTSKRKML